MKSIHDNIIHHDDLLKQYADLLPHKRKTDEEMERTAKMLLDKTEYLAQQKELSFLNKLTLIFKDISRSLMNPLEWVFQGNKVLRPAFAVTLIVLISFSVYFLAIKENNNIPITNKNVQTLNESKQSNAKESIAELKPISEEIDIMSLNVNSKAFNDGGTKKPIKKIILLNKANSAVIKTLNSKNILIASSDINSFTTEWIRNDNKISRLIITKKNGSAPSFIFVKQSLELTGKDLEKYKIMDKLDYLELVKQIKSQYYNSFE
jgi:hypothetical protein